MSNRNNFIIGPGPSPMPVSAGKSKDNWRGLKWMMLSVLSSSAMTIAARYASLELDSRVVVLMRGVMTVAMLLALLAASSHIRQKIRFSQPMAHIIRGVLITASTHFGFYTIATVPLATTTVLFFTAPIFATVLAVFIHKEAIGPRRIGAIFAGFAGVLIILRPGIDALEIGLITAILSSLTFAMALTMSRNLANADGPMSTYLSSTVIMAVLSVPVAAPVFTLPDMTFTWFALAALVITGSVRGIADIEAYRYADAALLTPITYLRLVFIGGAGYLFFSETIDGPTLVGAAIIIASTLYIAQRERSGKDSDR